jgi:hypothetical protein
MTAKAAPAPRLGRARRACTPSAGAGQVGAEADVRLIAYTQTAAINYLPLLYSQSRQQRG